MKSTLLLFLTILFATTTFAQNRSKFYHKIKKSDIESGYLKLVYKDKSGTIKNVSVCSEFLKGIITLDKGVPVIDFWTITDDKNSANIACISNNTELGKFEIDLTPM
jgi:hypothetical protein